MNDIRKECIRQFTNIFIETVKRLDIYDASSLLYDICEDAQIANINNFPIKDFNKWIGFISNKLYLALIENEIDIYAIIEYMNYYDIIFSYYEKYDELVIRQNDRVLCGIDISPYKPEEIGILIEWVDYNSTHL